MKTYILTDPRTNVQVSVYGWRKLCKLYRTWYSHKDEFARKQEWLENNVPVYRRTKRSRGGNIWYNAIRHPYIFMNN